MTTTPIPSVSTLQPPPFEQRFEERVQTILAACTAQDAQAEIMTFFDRLEYQSNVWKVACNRLGIACKNCVLDDNLAEAEYYFEKVLGHVLEHNTLPGQSDLHIILTELASFTPQLPHAFDDAADFERWLAENVDSLSRVTNLDLSKKGLTSIPECVFPYLKNLKTLSLTGNQLIALPDSIGELNDLEGLFLAGNQLKALPKTFFALKNLQYLSLDKNPIQEGLIFRIGRAFTLKNFSFNQH